MKKLLFIISIVGLISCGNAEKKSNDDVFICTGYSATKYHSSSDCMGLRRCSAEVEAITVTEAKSEGKTPCKICY